MYGIYPFELGEISARILFLWALPHIATIHREIVLMMKKSQEFPLFVGQQKWASIA